MNLKGCRQLNRQPFFVLSGIQLRCIALVKKKNPPGMIRNRNNLSYFSESETSLILTSNYMRKLIFLLGLIVITGSAWSQKALSKLTAGSPAPEFTLTDNHGQPVSLSSFRGKTVYMDFWASWCMPCVVAMPDSKKLMEKYKDRQDIIFLYVNVRDDTKKWQRFLKKQKMGGIHLFATRDQSDKLLSDYSFSGLPHYVLIDKDGNLVNPNSSRPDDAEKYFGGVE